MTTIIGLNAEATPGGPVKINMIFMMNATALHHNLNIDTSGSYAYSI